MADMPKFELPKEETRIWDLSVPVVNSPETNNIKAYITGSIDEPCDYNEICYLLQAADEGTVIDLYINTPGGIIDSAFMVANAIQASEAKTVAHLSGTVASAGTILAMACDEVDVAPHLSFMIHNYSGGMAGKGHEMKARQKFLDEHLNAAFANFYSGFLSEVEMERVLEGTDLWMGSEEVKERWQHRIEYLRT